MVKHGQRPIVMLIVKVNTLIIVKVIVKHVGRPIVMIIVIANTIIIMFTYYLLLIYLTNDLA